MSKLTKCTIISILLLQNFRIAYSQQLSQADSSILQFLSKEQAFLLWQEGWKSVYSNFNLTTFQFKEEKKLAEQFEQFKDSTSTEIIRSRKHLALTLFSPSGWRAVNPLAGSAVIEKQGYYILGHGDTDELRLYDFTKNKSFRLLLITNYGPLIDGIAWLADELLVGVGERFDLSGEFDKVAPAVMIFDLRKMTMRMLIGDFIKALDYYKTRKYGEKLLFEPRLAFLFHMENIKRSIK